MKYQTVSISIPQERAYHSAATRIMVACGVIAPSMPTLSIAATISPAVT
jgi:hypothetical protein